MKMPTLKCNRCGHKGFLEAQRSLNGALRATVLTGTSRGLGSQRKLENKICWLAVNGGSKEPKLISSAGIEFRICAQEFSISFLLTTSIKKIRNENDVLKPKILYFPSLYGFSFKCIIPLRYPLPLHGWEK